MQRTGLPLQGAEPAVSLLVMAGELEPYGIGLDGLWARIVKTAEATITAAITPMRTVPTGTCRLSHSRRTASQ